MAVFNLDNRAGHGFHMATSYFSGLDIPSNGRRTTVFDTGRFAQVKVSGNKETDLMEIKYVPVGEHINVTEMTWFRDGKFVASMEGVSFISTKATLGPLKSVKLNGYNDEFWGNDYKDFIRAGSGNDKVVAYAGGDTLYGDSGHDDLSGGNGTDFLNGGSGNDILWGGAGKDTLIGGSGADRFDFSDIAESRRGPSHDTIRDFKHGSDKIDLNLIDADRGSRGNQEFKFIGADAFTGEAGQLRFAGGLVQGDVDGDKVADLEILVRGRVTENDFFL